MCVMRLLYLGTSGYRPLTTHIERLTRKGSRMPASLDRRSGRWLGTALIVRVRRACAGLSVQRSHTCLWSDKGLCVEHLAQNRCSYTLHTCPQRGVQTVFRHSVHTVKPFETNRRGGDGRRRRPEVYVGVRSNQPFWGFVLPIEGK